MNRDFGLLDEPDQHQALRAAVEQAGFVDLWKLIEIVVRTFHKMSIFTLLNNLLEVFQKIIPKHFHFRLPIINELTHVGTKQIH
jgi:hypothetical protein